MMLRFVPQLLKTKKNCRKQNFDDKANNMQLDKKNTQQSNLKA